MSSLRAAWELAWAELPDVVHESFSKRRKPLKAVVTGMFPTAFEELDPTLRTYIRMRENRALDTAEEEQIRDAVRQAVPRLTEAALNYERFETCLEGDDLGMSNPLETLSRFAWKVAAEQGAVDLERARLLLDQEYPPAATLKNLKRALQDAALVDEVEAALSAVEPFVAPGGPSEEVSALAQAVLSSPTLAAVERSTDVVEPTETDRAAWFRLLEHPDVGSVHAVAPTFWLCYVLPVGVPRLFEPAPVPAEPAAGAKGDEVLPPPRALELSLVDRLRRSLDTDREQLAGLTPRDVLLAETQRVVSPLGLDARGALALFAMVREVAFEVGRSMDWAVRPTGLAARELPGTPVGRKFAAAVARVAAAKRRTGSYARVSHGVLSTLDDLTIRFAHELWGRTHGHDVRASLDLTDLGVVFTQLFLGVRETVLRRLDESGGSDFITATGELPDQDGDDPTTSWIATYAPPSRADALPELVRVIEGVVEAKAATYADVLRFLRYADEDPAYREVWDRWCSLCAPADWLTYDVVVAVLPLMRQETIDHDEGQV